MARNHIRKIPYTRYRIKIANHVFRCELCGKEIMVAEHFYDLNYDKRVHLECARKADSARNDVKAWNQCEKKKADYSNRRCLLCLQLIMKGDFYYSRLKKEGSVHVKCGDKES